MLGEAKKYVQRIYSELDNAGYYVQHYLLNAKTMGVPQRRERVFFVCLRKDLIDRVPVEYNLFDIHPHLELKFAEPPIKFGDFADYKGAEIRGETSILLAKQNPGR